jgi:hypothetical protein
MTARAFGGEPVFGDSRDGVLAAQCCRSGSFGLGFGLDDDGIDALGDQALPLAGRTPRLFQADRAIDADGAAARAASRWKRA